MEPNDGATISIVYEGDGETTPEFWGSCLEVAKPTVLPPADFYIQSRWERFKRSPALTLPIVVIIIIGFAGLAQGAEWLANKFPWLHLDIVGGALGWLFGSSFVALLLFAMLSDLAKKVLSAYIPPEIKP